jgi:hypothetical protein
MIEEFGGDKKKSISVEPAPPAPSSAKKTFTEEDLKDWREASDPTTGKACESFISIEFLSSIDYYNKATKERIWAKDMEPDLAAAIKDKLAKKDHEVRTSSAAPAPAASVSAEQSTLPPDWKAVVDKSSGKTCKIFRVIENDVH